MKNININLLLITGIGGIIVWLTRRGGLISKSLNAVEGVVTAPVEKFIANETAKQNALSTASFDKMGVFIGDANTLSPEQILILQGQNKFNPSVLQGQGVLADQGLFGSITNLF